MWFRKFDVFWAAADINSSTRKYFVALYMISAVNEDVCDIHIHASPDSKADYDKMKKLEWSYPSGGGAASGLYEELIKSLEKIEIEMRCGRPGLRPRLVGDLGHGHDMVPGWRTVFVITTTDLVKRRRSAEPRARFRETDHPNTPARDLRTAVYGAVLFANSSSPTSRNPPSSTLRIVGRSDSETLGGPNYEPINKGTATAE
ncbi:hypothetical protein RUM43_000268 [Polyplax serrata]|uniref:Uncharacterized protein n=1 Tax=Polyplax serrata TaxID=468196 RepID=A0AAN8XMW4_POLSC